MDNNNSKIFKDGDFRLEVRELGDNRRELTVTATKESIYLPREKKIETDYDVSFIIKLFKIKKGYVCDEIHREQVNIKHRLHTLKNAFDLHRLDSNLNILDFGSGVSSSTLVVNNNFPNSKITCVDLEKEFIELAKIRIEHHNLKNIDFIIPENAGQLPESISNNTYDLCFLSGVVEHLLPEERPVLMEQIWRLIKKNGMLFIFETPHRWFPIETHSTSLPFINYLPDSLAWRSAVNFTKKNRHRKGLNEMLRAGLRGITKAEIAKYFGESAKFMKPNKSKIHDIIDLWYYCDYHKSRRKHITYRFCKILKLITRIELTPWVTYCVKKT